MTSQDDRDQPKHNDSRWWEYYAVRYALGVGIGTPIVALLWRSYTRLAVPHFSPDSVLSNTTAALLWAAAGMAYCYVASVPMLTLHSTRRLLRNTHSNLFALLLIILGVIGVGVWLDVTSLTSPSRLRNIAMLSLAGIAALQLFAVLKTLWHSEKTQGFYEELARHRSGHAEYVESYRHMREHGNSISIVLFELLLGFILWALRPESSQTVSVASVGRVVLILVIWLSPAALVCLIGSSLERHLALGFREVKSDHPGSGSQPS